MPRRRPLVAFEITPELKEGLDAIKERDGVPISEQIRRGIQMWLVEKGALKATKKPAKRR
jgi:hypothetical protein